MHKLRFLMPRRLHKWRIGIGIVMLLLTLLAFRSHLSPRRKRPKWAYVFYVTESDYICYAMVNAGRLLDNLSMTMDAEIMILAMERTHIDWFCENDSCRDGRIKVRHVARAPSSLTDNVYYGQSYLRFEAFRLFDLYERVIILDADGLVLRNMDHLFKVDLKGAMLGGVAADYAGKRWLSSVLLVAEPSPRLWAAVEFFLHPDTIGRVGDFANGSRYDMDILNYVFERGSAAALLPADYARLDAHFFDSERDEEFGRAYYVHFSAKKPFAHQESETWVMTGKFPLPALGMRLMFTWFWEGFYRECKPLVKRLEPVEYFKKDKGYYYPDPNDMADYINNISNSQYGNH